MFLNRLVSILAVLILLGVVAAFFVIRSEGPPSYLSFSNRDPHYYSEVAEACDKLLVLQAVPAMGRRTLLGNDESLPPILRSIHAHSIYVETSRVYIDVGIGGRASYGIIWEQDDNHLSWELSTVIENLRKVLFSKKK